MEMFRLSEVMKCRPTGHFICNFCDFGVSFELFSLSGLADLMGFFCQVDLFLDCFSLGGYIYWIFCNKFLLYVARTTLVNKKRISL